MSGQLFLIIYLCDHRIEYECHHPGCTAYYEMVIGRFLASFHNRCGVGGCAVLSWRGSRTLLERVSGHGPHGLSATSERIVLLP